MKKRERQDSAQSDSASIVPAKLSCAEAYQEMAKDPAERLEWSDWDALAGNGPHD